MILKQLTVLPLKDNRPTYFFFSQHNKLGAQQGVPPAEFVLGSAKGRSM